MKPWPKLSEQLTGPRDAWHCQKRARSTEDLDTSPTDVHLTIWKEHDDNDKPIGVYVALCSDCDHDGFKKTLIQRHPRLYDDVPEHAPFPGMIHLCRNCAHRAGWDCSHPDLKKNGGHGLQVIFPEPERSFIDGSRGGRRWGTMLTKYRPAQSCAGQNLEHGVEQTLTGLTADFRRDG